LSEQVSNLLKRLESGSSSGAQQMVAAMRVQELRTFEVTAGDLKAAIEANPDHPIADNLKKGIRGMKAKQTVYVDRVDLEALIKDCDVIVSTKEVEDPDDADGRVKVQTKKLGARRQKETPARPSASPLPPKKAETKAE
jgi:hypothetical protein